VPLCGQRQLFHEAPMSPPLGEVRIGEFPEAVPSFVAPILPSGFIGSPG